MEGYLSVDLETTDLDPDVGQILEFAAVFDDLKTPRNELKTFRRLVLDRDGVYKGGAIAMSMNAELLKQIGDIEIKIKKQQATCFNQTDGWCYADQLVQDVCNWLTAAARWYGETVTFAGKNFATFDRGFLKKPDYKGFFDKIPMHRRVIDPASMWWSPKDDGFTLPDSKLCKERAGITGSVQHKALDDAFDVVDMIRAKGFALAGC